MDALEIDQSELARRVGCTPAAINQIVVGKTRHSRFFHFHSIVALLDLADEHLQCTALVISLERASPTLSELLHSLMYVGGTVVTHPPAPSSPAYVLVGMEM